MLFGELYYSIWQEPVSVSCFWPWIKMSKVKVYLLMRLRFVSLKCILCKNLHKFNKTSLRVWRLDKEVLTGSLSLGENRPQMRMLRFYLCLGGVGAIVQLQEELSAPRGQQRRVGMKLWEKLWRTGHLDPVEHPKLEVSNIVTAVDAVHILLHFKLEAFCLGLLTNVTPDLTQCGYNNINLLSNWWVGRVSSSVWAWLLLLMGDEFMLDWNRPGKSICVPDKTESVDHVLRGSTTPVPEAKQSCAVVRSAFIFVILHSFYKLWLKHKTQQL